MKVTLANVLIVVALAGGLVLLAITAGLFPAAEPAPLEPIALVVPKTSAVPPRPMPEPPAKVVPQLAAVTLCDAPEEGARLELAGGPVETPSFFVWCKGGYALFSLDSSSVPAGVTKLAHLPTRMPRPGGALLDDVSADGLADLVVAVAPAAGLIHAAGSGVFLAKGRAQGGYEAAAPLLEMPVVAVRMAQIRPSPAGRDLFVLTRGDAAARRQGELHWLEPAAVLSKKGVFAAGLSPRDLRFVQAAPDALPQALIATSEPGRVLALSPTQAGEAARELPLTDVVDVCGSVDSRVALVRSTHDLWRMPSDASTVLTPWFRDANVGRCVTGDFDGDGVLDALGTTDGGVIWLHETGEDNSRELLLPKGFRALDVAFVPGAQARVLALALDVEHGRLLSLVWPAATWSDGVEATLSVQSARDAPALAEIPLE